MFVFKIAQPPKGTENAASEKSAVPFFFFFEVDAFTPLTNYIVVMTTPTLYAVCIRPVRPPEIYIK